MPPSLDKVGVLKTLPKFKQILNSQSYRMAHPIYRTHEIETIKKYHHEPEYLRDRIAMSLIWLVRTTFDTVTRYNPQTMNERDWLNRIVFLETVAGVPGMIGGMSRHLRSLRTMENDHGWIHHLLQEAENERMHLFIFLSMRNPGIFMRLGIALAQGAFFNSYFLMYILSPKFSHRFVGYLEEEAVHTYTKCLNAIDEGRLPLWKEMAAPEEAVEYYGLNPAKNPTMRDVILCVRADESMHRSINHHFSNIPQFYDIQTPEIELKDSFMIDEASEVIEKHQNDKKETNVNDDEEQELRAKLRM